MNKQGEKYSNYLIEDFIWDDSFRSWVNQPTDESNQFWLQWLIDNPGKNDVAESAKQIIKALQVKVIGIDTDEIDLEFEKILTAAELALDKSSFSKTSSKRLRSVNEIESSIEIKRKRS